VQTPVEPLERCLSARASGWADALTAAVRVPYFDRYAAFRLYAPPGANEIDVDALV